MNTVSCNNCKSDWRSEVLTRTCPFCKEDLPVANIYEEDSLEGKMMLIVEKQTTEIYTKPQDFVGAISDYYADVEIGKLLKLIVSQGASTEVLKLKDATADNLNTEYAKTLDKISADSYIAKDVLMPAINLLCIGLWIDVKKIDTANPQKEESRLTDFKIEGETLLQYFGKEKDVVIPHFVTTIGESAFENSESVVTVTMPNSITQIGASAFKNCQNLTSINIPTSLEFISNQTFQGCISLTSITLPDTVTWIGDYAFNNCQNLKSVNIPASVTQINDYAFRSCPNLTSITIPNSVTRACRNSFWWST